MKQEEVDLFSGDTEASGFSPKPLISNQKHRWRKQIMFTKRQERWANAQTEYQIKIY